jgi:hypothetical protein
MATSASDLRTRIRNAAVPDLIGFDVEDFSNAEDRADYEFLVRQFRKTEATGSGGGLAASLAAMSDEECVEVAERIRKLELSLRSKVVE